MYQKWRQSASFIWYRKFENIFRIPLTALLPNKTPASSLHYFPLTPLTTLLPLPFLLPPLLPTLLQVSAYNVLRNIPDTKHGGDFSKTGQGRFFMLDIIILRMTHYFPKHIPNFLDTFQPYWHHSLTSEYSKNRYSDE